MSQASSLVIPIVLWGKEAPTHVITAMAVSAELTSIVTGCNDGQIIIWDVRQLAESHRHSNAPSPMSMEDESAKIIANENNNSNIDESSLCDQTCFEVKSAFGHNLAFLCVILNYKTSILFIPDFTPMFSNWSFRINSFFGLCIDDFRII